MRTIANMVMAIALTIGSVTPSMAFGPLKGDWTFRITPDGQPMFVTGFRFKAKEVGRALRSPFKNRGISYRETDTDFSATWEFAMPTNGTGSGTVVFRGTKTSDTTVEGTMLLISDAPDPLSATGYLTIRGTFTGVRDQ